DQRVQASLEAGQVMPGSRLGVRLTTIALGALLASCSSTQQAPIATPVVLPTRCERGPFCITGEVDDQFSIAVEGAKCVALLETGSRPVLSDARGFFFMDGLATLPRQVRFEKAGFNAQSVSVLPVTSG